MEIIDYMKMGGAGVLLFLLSLIKIPKLELNLWGWFGRMLNKEVMDEVKCVKKDVEGIRTELDKHITDNKLEAVRSARRRILRFNDEIFHSQSDEPVHSKEHYEEILGDIGIYRAYCKQDENFENSKCEIAMENIEERYAQAVRDKRFLW